MNEVNATSCDAAKCLTFLKCANRPMVAADIAKALCLAGNRETQRRHVRAIIKELRDEGEWIVATLHGGYWLTDDRAIWKDYIEGRNIDAKRILGVNHKRSKMLTDGHGQGVLFRRQYAVGLG